LPRAFGFGTPLFISGHAELFRRTSCFLCQGADRSGFLKEDRNMNMSGESLAIILIVGIAAGWLAGQIVQGTGFGLVGDLVVGVLGAFFGSWLFPQLGLHLGAGLVGAIVSATIGAVILLLIVALIRGGSGRRWGRGL
jgi:uncharacterized membrane protein YeaQ/YmgE (transglycosylase-associated protein family)